jgi:predicted RNase H-like nuclease
VIRCVGIDLAWSPRNSSGAFVLEADGAGTAHTIDWGDSLQDDDDILVFVAQACEQGPALVAVDAPLAVPNACGARPCDREITRVFGRFQAGAHPANRQALARYGGLRGERLAQRIVQELDFAHCPYIARHAATRQLIEIHPLPPNQRSRFGLTERTRDVAGSRLCEQENPGDDHSDAT